VVIVGVLKVSFVLVMAVFVVSSTFVISAGYDKSLLEEAAVNIDEEEEGG
jgi:hypothetical protein